MERADIELELLVRRRAAGRCEYCGLPEEAVELPFQLDHIVARKHKGPTTPENLAFACLNCNSYKGPNLLGVDPDTGEIVRLFHPRKQKWAEHFVLEGARIIGKTPEARATIEVLNMNQEQIVRFRESLIEEGRI